MLEGIGPEYANSGNDIASQLVAKLGRLVSVLGEEDTDELLCEWLRKRDAEMACVVRAVQEVEKLHLCLLICFGAAMCVQPLFGQRSMP